MDFSILKISADMEFEDNLPLERVFVLLYGEIEVEFNGKIVKGTTLHLHQRYDLERKLAQGHPCEIAWYCKRERDCSHSN